MLASCLVAPLRAGCPPLLSAPALGCTTPTTATNKNCVPKNTTSRTGLGDDTAVVPTIQGGDRSLCGIKSSRQEFAQCCFAPILEALDKAGVPASEVDFVITNSSLFNPTPSLSAVVMNHFKMRRTARGFSLGGMGCRCARRGA